MGFSQFEVTAGTSKKGTPYRRVIRKGKPELFPTPWNHLESWILFALNVPFLVFREQNISGGVFDNGVTDLFIHPMPMPEFEYADKNALRAVFNKWAAEARAHYYGEP